MRAKLVLAAFVTAFLPTMALAMCPGKSHKVVQSCATGEVINPISGQCEKPASS